MPTDAVPSVWHAMLEDRVAVKADHDAAKREALTGIGHCIFS